MTNYRRELNFNYCNSVDYVIWGETDCLVPKEMFLALEQIKEYANSQNIHRYITTFATRKMWDDSWKVLEHPKFTNCKYLERDDTGAFTEPHSIRYVMSLEEMNDINSEADEFELQILQQPKFDGSILVMSADLLKMGVNIPPGFLDYPQKIQHLCTIVCKELVLVIFSLW